jgi:O-antigen/teichoic acid export membrane protein
MSVPTVPTDAAPAGRALVRAGTVVAVATAGANVVSFALTIVLGNVLSVGDFGAVVALLGVAIVGQVPAMALQVVVARHVATATDATRPGQARALLVHAALVGAAVAALAAVITVPMAGLLHLDSPFPMAWLAVSLAPVTLIFAVQGLLQGAERFTALGVFLVVMAVTRVAGGLAGGVATGPSGVFAGIALGAVVALAVALFLVRGDLTRTAPAAEPTRPREFYGELWTAVAGMGALLALTNVDVMLARHYLSRHDSGLYAAGAVASKIAFWFPQAIAVVVFPRLTDPEQRAGLLAKAATVVVGLGVLTSVGTAVLGPWILGILLDPEYRTLGATLGVFAAAGAAGTLVQLLLYSGIATRDRAITGVLVGALVVLVGVVSTVAHGSVNAIIVTVLSTLVALTVVGLLLTRRRSRATAPA